jgi:hypothetical protein
MGNTRNAYIISIGNFLGKRSIGRSEVLEEEGRILSKWVLKKQGIS